MSETRDSFSDSLSDESESEKLSRWDGCSSEEGMCEHDSLWHHNERLGNLYLQYFERSSPYGRVPLTDKVTLNFVSLIKIEGRSVTCMYRITNNDQESIKERRNIWL